MRAVGKFIALFYGSQMILASIGMGLFFYLNQELFAKLGQEAGADLRPLVFVGLIPQVGLGVMLVWLGISSRTRCRIYRSAKKALRVISDL